MELLLLLLIVFLQLGGRWGGGRGGSGLPTHRGPRTPEQPQPCCYRAPGGRSRESHWGGERDTLQGDACSPQSALRVPSRAWMGRE